MGNFEGECSKEEQKSELVGQGTSVEQKWMFDGSVFSLSNGRLFHNEVDFILTRGLLTDTFRENFVYLQTRETSFKRTFQCSWDIWLLVGCRVESNTMAGISRKGSGRPSYYYRFLGKSRLQRQRSRSRSRTRPSTSRGNKYDYCCKSFSAVYTKQMFSMITLFLCWTDRCCPLTSQYV